MAEPEHEMHRSRHARRGTRRLLAIAVVVIIIIAAAWLLLTGGGFTNVTASRVATLTTSPSYFALGSGQYALSLIWASKGSGVAYVYVERLPVFVNPLLNVTLSLNNITTVNSGSAWATMGLTLQSIGTGNVSVKITPLDPALHLAPNSSRISVVGTLLTSTKHANASALTVTTTVSATTTINQGNVTQNAIKAALAKSAYYAQILNYTRLYVGTVNCTAPLYNTTFTRFYSTQPTAGSTFYNVSVQTPYAVSNATASIGNGNYSVTFSTKTIKMFNNVAAMVLKVNVSASKVYNVTVGGVFTKQTLTTLQNNYKSAVNLGGACGVDVA